MRYVHVERTVESAAATRTQKAANSVAARNEIPGESWLNDQGAISARVADPTRLPVVPAGDDAEATGEELISEEKTNPAVD
jgi:hypothetical protein